MQPAIKNIRKTKRYREKGMSYRDIARLLESDVKTVFRWANYDLAEIEKKLSTRKVLPTKKK